jgi:hypothetical protein
VKSETTAEFWEQYYRLPAHVRQRARMAYQHFQTDPHHPSLRFKRVDPIEPLYSVRITDNYRAVGLLEGDTILWAFIGTHEESAR